MGCEIKKKTNALERVYSDVCGPVEEATFGGAKYFVSFVDGYSRMIEVYLVSNKSEMFDNIWLYKKKFEVEHDRKLKQIRSDNGGEYKNNLMKIICQRNGVIMEITAPYASHQNGWQSS